MRAWLAVAVGVLCGLSNLAGTAAVTFVPPASTWMYWTGSPFNSNAWKNPSFSALTGWGTAPAPMGYGAKGIATTLSYGGVANKKNLVVYFRKQFQATVPLGVTANLSLSLTFYDGCMAFIDGNEVARFNIGTNTTPVAVAGSFPLNLCALW